jgi:hypothetical protein
MDSPVSSSLDWYERDDLLSSFQAPTVPSAAGLPDSWQHYRWWYGGFIFSVLWAARSLKTGEALIGPTYLNHLTRDLWSLLVTLGVCYGIAQFCKSSSEKLAYGLCMLIAAGALAGHMML